MRSGIVCGRCCGWYRIPGWLVFTILAACGRSQPQWPRHPEWVFDTKLVFLSEDLVSAPPAPPLTQFPIVFPYISGDLYGVPTTGDLLNPTLRSDYHLHLDLNQAQDGLAKSLEETDFSLSYLHIVPSDARIARLAPMVLQAQGIEQIGRTDWVDELTRRRLLLVYFDRPATIKGSTTALGKPLRYEVRAERAGYVWISPETGSQGVTYRAVQWPAEVILAVTPLENAVTHK